MPSVPSPMSSLFFFFSLLFSCLFLVVLLLLKRYQVRVSMSVYAARPIKAALALLKNKEGETEIEREI